MSQPEKWTNRALLTWTKAFFEKRGIETPKLDAEVLLGYATGRTRLDLFVSYDEEPTEEQRGVFRELVRRRALGEPVAYLVGKKEFYSLDFAVDARALIPRPETEQLVLETIEYFKKRGWRTGAAAVKKRSVEIEERVAEFSAAESEAAESPAVERSDSEPRDPGELWICDVGVGSGCVSAALAKNIPSCRVLGLDVSPEALEVARENVERLGLSARVELRESDLFSAVPDALPEEERFDAIVSNPPYVSESEYVVLETTVRDFEPRLALVGGASGAELAIELVRQAVDRIKIGGRLALELSPTTVETVARELTQDGRWTDVAIHKDFAGLLRFVAALRA